MRWLGYREVAVKSIHCDVVDIRRRMKEPHVAALAKDIAAAGEQPIHAPTVREDGQHTLLCGRDRLAASMLNKAKKLWVHIAECTDQEAKQLELRENIYRRPVDNRAEQLAQLVELQKQQIRASEAETIGDSVHDSDAASKSRKSDKQVTAAARKEVARAAGVSTAAVKKAEQRAASKEVEKEEQPSAEIELPEGFNDFELDLPAEAKAAIGRTALWLNGRDWELRNILSELTDAAKTDGYALAAVHVQKIREAVQTAGHAVRAAIPASLCFFCKAQPALTPNCNACGGMGVVGRHGGDNVPPELKRIGADTRVAVDGKIVPIGGAANAAEASKPSKPRKRLRVEDENGNDITPPSHDATCLCGHAYQSHAAENAGGGNCSECTCEMYEVESGDEEVAFG